MVGCDGGDSGLLGICIACALLPPLLVRTLLWSMDPSSSSSTPLCEFSEDSDSSSLRLGGPRDIEGEETGSEGKGGETTGNTLLTGVNTLNPPHKP